MTQPVGSWDQSFSAELRNQDSLQMVEIIECQRETEVVGTGVLTNHLIRSPCAIS